MEDLHYYCLYHAMVMDSNKVAIRNCKIRNCQQSRPQPSTCGHLRVYDGHPKTVVVDLHKFGKIRPPFDIYCGRNVQYTEFTEKSKWANPFTKGRYGTLHDFEDKCLRDYEIYICELIQTNPKKYDLRELVHKRLGCWCVTTDQIYPLKCHCQILLKLIKEKELE